MQSNGVKNNYKQNLRSNARGKNMRADPLPPPPIRRESICHQIDRGLIRNINQEIQNKKIQKDMQLCYLPSRDGRLGFPTLGHLTEVGGEGTWGRGPTGGACVGVNS